MKYAHQVTFQVSDIAAFQATELFSWEKSGKYRNESQYELSLLSLLIYFIHGSTLSEFSQSDVPQSNTLLLGY